MKNLILIIALLLCVKLNAQPSGTVTVYSGNNYQRAEKIVPVITIQDLMDYKTDCYNDSTEKCFYRSCDWDCWETPCQKGSKLISGFPCTCIYIHKKPTFEGFLDYIIKQKH